MIYDILLLLIGMVGELWRQSHVMFGGVAALGGVLAGGAWWLTSWVAHNYNRQFSMQPQHHVYCAVAAIITFFFTLLFSALHYTGEVAKYIVYHWKEEITVDKKWSDDTYRRAYEAVYELRDSSGKQLENFAGSPHPDKNLPTFIPTNHQESRQLAAQTYANAAVNHFKSQHPFLSKILWADPEVAKKVIAQDMERVFGSGAHFYKPKDAIQLASAEILQGLRKQVPRIVIISRILLVVGFFLVQGITFFLLRYAALAAIPEKQMISSVKGV